MGLGHTPRIHLETEKNLWSRKGKEKRKIHGESVLERTRGAKMTLILSLFVF